MEALLIAVIVIAFIRRITKKSYVALTYLLTSSSLFLYLWNLQLVCSNRKGASQIMSEQQKGSRVYIFEARRRILLGSNRFFFAPFHFSRQTSRILKKPLPPRQLNPSSPARKGSYLCPHCRGPCVVCHSRVPVISNPLPGHAAVCYRRQWGLLAL